MAQQIHQ